MEGCTLNGVTVKILVSVAGVLIAAAIIATAVAIGRIGSLETKQDTIIKNQDRIELRLWQLEHYTSKQRAHPGATYGD